MHLSVLQSLMIVVYPIHQILFLISYIQFEYHVFKIICSLNYNKAHGYDDISMRLLKVCDSSIVRPLSIVFRNCLQIGTFPRNWKKSNVVPIHKKDDKQHYRPVWLLQYLVKFSKELPATQCLNFLKKIISVHTNPDFVHLTHVKVSYYPLFMTAMLVLTKILPST